MGKYSNELGQRLRNSGKSTGGEPSVGTPIVGNDMWDDLRHIYSESMRSIQLVEGHIMEQLGEIVKSGPGTTHFTDEDIAAMAENTKVLCNDMTRHIRRIEEAHALHAGKEGNARTDEEINQALSASLRYSEAQGIYDSVIQPTVDRLLELLGDTEGAMMDQFQALAEQTQRKD